MTILKKDLDLARRIRGERFHDHRDLQPKTGKEVFYMLPYYNEKDHLADLKKVIDNNSGLATSAWLGKTQQSNDPAGRKTASDRGNTIYSITAADAAEFAKLSSHVDEEWVADMTKKGFDGKKLLETAKALIEKHGKA